MDATLINPCPPSLRLGYLEYQSESAHSVLCSRSRPRLAVSDGQRQGRRGGQLGAAGRAQTTRRFHPAGGGEEQEGYILCDCTHALYAKYNTTVICLSVCLLQLQESHDHSHAHSSHAHASSECADATCTDPTHDHSHDHKHDASAHGACTDATHDHDHSHGDDGHGHTHSDACADTTCTDPTHNHDHSHSHTHSDACADTTCTDPTHNHDHSHDHSHSEATTAAQRFGITSFVYKRRRPFHPIRFTKFLQGLGKLSVEGIAQIANGQKSEFASPELNKAQKSLLRSKGFVWMATSGENEKPCPQWDGVNKLIEYLFSFVRYIA